MNCFCRCYGRRAGSIYYKINNKVIMPHLRSQRARREGVMGVALRALALKRFGPPARSRSRLGTDLEICTSLVTSKAALRHTNTRVCTTTAQHSLSHIVFSGPVDHDYFHRFSAYDIRRWPPPPRPTRPALSSVLFCARASNSLHTTSASTQGEGQWMLSGRLGRRATSAKCRS